MNTTVTVETVHGLKDKFVVGGNGIVSVTESASTADANLNDTSGMAAPTSGAMGEDRPAAR